MRKPVRVVIADDHQVVREGLQMILADSDGEIVVVGEASDGEEAVRLATAIKPDVVLMDRSVIERWTFTDEELGSARRESLDQRHAGWCIRRALRPHF